MGIHHIHLREPTVPNKQIMIISVAFFCLVVLATGYEAVRWEDTLAEAACLGATRKGYIYAVPRDSDADLDATCEDICGDPTLIDQDDQVQPLGFNGNCLNALKIYPEFPGVEAAALPPQHGQLRLKVYRYDSCKTKGRTANYCCCNYHKRNEPVEYYTETR